MSFLKEVSPSVPKPTLTVDSPIKSTPSFATYKGTFSGKFVVYGLTAAALSGFVAIPIEFPVFLF